MAKDRKKDQQRARAAEARRQREEQANKPALDAKLSEISPFNALDQEQWALLYARMEQFSQRADLIERWARLLQHQISAGWSVDECALPTLTEANYGSLPDEHFIRFAVPILHQTWAERQAADALMHWLTVRAQG